MIISVSHSFRPAPPHESLLHAPHGFLQHPAAVRQACPPATMWHADLFREEHAGFTATR